MFIRQNYWIYLLAVSCARISLCSFSCRTDMVMLHNLQVNKSQMLKHQVTNQQMLNEMRLPIFFLQTILHHINQPNCQSNKKSVNLRRPFYLETYLLSGGGMLPSCPMFHRTWS